MNIATPKTYSSTKTKKNKARAGIVLYKYVGDQIHIFLVQGNNCNVTFTDGMKKFTRGKVGIPKGSIEEKEDPEKCARREFNEETGMLAGPLVNLSKYIYVTNMYSGEFRECSEVLM